MPIYELQCPDDHITDVICRIDDRPDKIECECGRMARRIISCPVVHGFEEYADEDLVDEGGSGAFHVKSRNHKRRRLRDLGLEEREPTYETRAKKTKGTIFSGLGAGRL